MSRETEPETVQTPLAKEIEIAAAGLWYMSETDAEIIPFTGSKSVGVTKEILLDQIGSVADETVEERGFDEMFERLVAIKDWHNDQQKETAARFGVLKKLLSDNLSDLKVFKVGDVRRDVYFVGLDSEGRLAGIKTFAVET